MRAISTWQAIQAMAYHSLDLAVYAWPVSVALIVAAVCALTIGAPFRDQLFRRRLKLMLITYVIPVLMMVVGVILRYDGPPGPSYLEPAAWRGVALWAVLIAHLIAFIGAVTLMGGMRIRAAVIVLPSIWLSLSAGFIAGIAIAGVGP